MEEETIKEEKKTIDVFPLSKGKRALAFLADYFLCFILGLASFHLIAYPIGRAIVDAEGQATSLIEAETARDSVLYGHGLLHYDSNKETMKPASYLANLEYTCLVYLSTWIEDSPNSKYEVFSSYYVGILHDEAALDSFYASLNEKASFLVKKEGTWQLKETYKEEFAPAIDPQDEMGEQGKKDYKTFQEKFFLKGYSVMLSSINEKDLVYEGVSYVEQQKIVSSILKQQQNLILYCALAAMFNALMACFFLIPMVSKNRKTLGMMFMRLQRVRMGDFTLVSRKDVFPYLVYQIALNISSLFFLPLPVLGFNELFTLTTPLFVSLASLVLVLVSGIFLLVNGFNRSLLDMITGSMLIRNDQLDEIYRAKGYDF